ncbi:MAG: DNA gyrase subunit A, partial [Erysipelotrichaceae bacterium]|nr:DNA gyrase subunit A [Erysipelotrichaceae bacterium]
DVNANPELEHKFMFFVTKKGLVKRTEMSEFLLIRQTGKIAISMKEDDELFGAMLTNGSDEIIIAGNMGKAIRFNEQDVRPMGRTASGVRGFVVEEGECVVGISTNYSGEYLLSVTEKGYGKMTPIEDYRLTKRGGKGVSTINITEKNGPLAAVKAVNGDEGLLIMTTQGTTIRITLDNVARTGRNTQGVKLINLDENTKVATLALTEKYEEEADEAETSEETVPAEEQKAE